MNVLELQCYYCKLALISLKSKNHLYLKYRCSNDECFLVNNVYYELYNFIKDVCTASNFSIYYHNKHYHFTTNLLQEKFLILHDKYDFANQRLRLNDNFKIKITNNCIDVSYIIAEANRAIKLDYFR